MTAPRGEPEPESQPATDPTGPLPATTSGGPVSVRCQGCGHPLGTLRSTGTGRGWEADWTGARAVHAGLVRPASTAAPGSWARPAGSPSNASTATASGREATPISKTCPAGLSMVRSTWGRSLIAAGDRPDGMPGRPARLY